MEKIICGKCGQIHNKCNGHKRRKKKTDPLVPCQKSPMQNGTCDLHGGKIPVGIASPHFKDGKYSKYLNTSLAEKVRTAENDYDLVSLRSEIALVTGMTEDRLEKIHQGKDVDAWYLMEAKYNEYQQNLEDWDEYKEKKETYDEKIRLELSLLARRGKKAESKIKPPKEPRESAEILHELGDVLRYPRCAITMSP